MSENGNMFHYGSPGSSSGQPPNFKAKKTHAKWWSRVRDHQDPIFSWRTTWVRGADQARGWAVHRFASPSLSISTPGFGTPLDLTGRQKKHLPDRAFINGVLRCLFYIEQARCCFGVTGIWCEDSWIFINETRGTHRSN